MTNTDFLEKLVVLTDKLERISSSDPYDQDAYNSVLLKIHLLQLKRNRSLRWRPSFMFYVICFLIVMLGFVVWGIIRPL